jgi:hypothetical protein
VPRFVTAAVIEILEARPGLQKVRVERADGRSGDRAYVLTQVIGEVAPGDTVVLNTTAVELGLGTGGWHVVHWNLARTELDITGPGHVMKARYLSEQVDAGASEEDAVPSEALAGLPVVACLLLSQAAVAMLAFKRERPEAHIAVIVTDQAALPVAFSDLLYALRHQGVVATIITSGQAFGGDQEAVNLASALGLAHAAGVDAVFVTEGPGVVGTGSKYGFSGFEMAGVVDLVHKLGGTPYVAVRYSDADGRERHQGVSHHTNTVLAQCDDATVAVPLGEPLIATRRHICVSVDAGDVRALLASFPLPITTMGRSIDEDERFFLYAAAAGVAAAQQ